MTKTIKFTATMIEELLSTKEYAPVERLNKRDLTQEQFKEVQTLEDISFLGQDIITLFDTMIYELGTLPTQSQYCDKGVDLAVSFLNAERPSYKVTPLIKEAIKLRLTRTYMSKVVELHFEAMMAEELPHVTVKSFPLLDSVMGVDFILETKVKRYYAHITSDTKMAMDMIKRKEKGGGYQVGSAKIPYSRDFDGDLILKYNVREDTASTKIVNGFPLFKADFIQWELDRADKNKALGEPLKAKATKLGHFKQWAKTYLRMNITSI